jgi:hypothetical protein
LENADLKVGLYDYLGRRKKRRTGRRTNFWNASHPAYTSDQTDMPEAYSLYRGVESDLRLDRARLATAVVPHADLKVRPCV